MNSLSAVNIDLIKIKQILVTNAAISNETQLSTLEKGKHEFKLTFNFSLGHNIKDKKFRIIFSCGIKTLNEQSEEINVTAKFDIAFLFTIENIEELITKPDNSEIYTIDNDLITSLANLSYSTSRGIIYTKCQGTILKTVIIPIISTQKLLEILQPANKMEQ